MPTSLKKKQNVANKRCRQCWNTNRNIKRPVYYRPVWSTLLIQPSIQPSIQTNDRIAPRTWRYHRIHQPLLHEFNFSGAIHRMFLKYNNYSTLSYDVICQTGISPQSMKLNFKRYALLMRLTGVEFHISVYFG